MKNVTAVLITFLRPDYTKACIDSLRTMYPEIKIIVAENGEHDTETEKYCNERGARYIKMEYDAGVCVARNELVKQADTEYVLVGDDDFFYDKNAGVGQMKDFLEGHPEYDLIGGRTSLHGIVQNYQGIIEKRSNHFQTTAIDPEIHAFETDARSGLRYCSADLTFNYFLGRTEKIRQTLWDEEIKVAYEHFSWFYDFKLAGGKVAFTPDAVVVHKPDHIARKVVELPAHHTYQAYRNRKSDRERFFSKYKLAYVIGMNGVKTYAPDHKVEQRRNDTKFVDFCIPTFMRKDALKRLLFSIAEQYPMANVYVADQSKELDREFYKKLRSDLYDAGLIKRLSVEHLPYDCGLSYARNHLVTTTPNRLKLILDDDMMFTEETDIGKMIRVLEADPRAGIVGGMVKQLGTEVHFEFTPEKEGDTIYHRADKGNWKSHGGARYKKTGCVLNFAIMKKEIFDNIQWDSALKVTEHLDFYLRFKVMPYNVLYTPDVIVDHPPAERVEGYKQMRQRPEFQVMMMKKHGAKRIKYLNGQVVELMPDGSLKRYKEHL